MKVLITRPRYQSEHLLQELRKQGYETELLPLLDIEPIAYSEQQKQQWVQRLLQAHFIISVSANAARLAVNLLDAVNLKSNSALPLYAIGPSTARVFSEAGFNTRIPETNYNSESLLELPDFNYLNGSNHLKGKQVVILCGEGGRDYLERKLHEAGAKTERIELYQRAPINHDQLGIEQLSEPDVLTAMSGDTVNALARAIDASNISTINQWKDLPLIVPSERVAYIASEQSFTKIVTAEKPTTDSLLGALGQLVKGV